MKFETLDQGRITVAEQFAPLLRANGLDTFEKVMSSTGGKVAREFPGRRTVRIELKSADGTMGGFFLKRYEPNYLSAGRRLLRLLHLPGAEDEAWREWQMLRQVQDAGIPTATPVAAGWEGAGGSATRSFLMTAEIEGAIEGHTWVERLSARERRNFLVRIAGIARRFHQAGFVHKDFYAGHVLVVPSPGEPELFLIDLQRVTKPCCFRGRWVAKDVGSMAYSVLKAGASRADLLRAFLVYSGKQQMDAKGKRFVRKVVKRVAWLLTRRPKHDGWTDKENPRSG